MAIVRPASILAMTSRSPPLGFVGIGQASPSITTPLFFSDLRSSACICGSSASVLRLLPTGYSSYNNSLMAKRDLYEVLGIPKSASADEIKKAHRKAVRQHHPDRNKNNPQAEEKFREAQ